MKKTGRKPQPQEGTAVRVEITNKRGLARQINQFLKSVEESRRQSDTESTSRKLENRIMVGTIKFRVKKN